MDQVRSVSWRSCKLVNWFNVFRFFFGYLLVCWALSFVACSPGVNFVRPEPALEDTSLGSGDVFVVRVFGEPELSQEYKVAEDGTIDFPYLGRLAITGRVPSQIADEIQRLLLEREILRYPQVSVLVKESNSKRLTILGSVQRPGTLPYESNMTIMEAITRAGGFSNLADDTRVRLTRRVRNGALRTYEIPCSLISDGRVENIRVAPGDIIFVPQSRI